MLITGATGSVGETGVWLRAEVGAETDDIARDVLLARAEYVVCKKVNLSDFD